MKFFLFILSLIFLPYICVAQDSITVSDIRSTEKIISIHFTPSKEDSLLESVKYRSQEYDKMHRFSLDNSIPITMIQSPLLPYMDLNKEQLPVKFSIPAGINMPVNKNDLAFYSIPQLAALIKNKKISSIDLTK